MGGGADGNGWKEGRLGMRTVLVFVLRGRQSIIIRDALESQRLDVLLVPSYVSTCGACELEFGLATTHVTPVVPNGGGWNGNVSAVHLAHPRLLELDLVAALWARYSPLYTADTRMADYTPRAKIHVSSLGWHGFFFFPSSLSCCLLGTYILPDPIVAQTVGSIHTYIRRCCSSSNVPT
jgi:hypothetical protein